MEAYNTLSSDNYRILLRQVGDALNRGRGRTASAVNAAMVATYWEIGRYIVEYEQTGKERAEYGSELLKQLAKDLAVLHGDGFSYSNLYRMRQMYLAYPIFATVGGADKKLDR